MKVNYLYKTLLVIFCIGAVHISKAQNQTLTWVKGFTPGASGDSEAYDITVDAQGNVYTVGDFSGVVDFDPGVGTFTLSSIGPGGNDDSFISKFDGAGNFLWVKQIGSVSPDRSSSVEVDGAGNVYITGHFSQTCDFDPGPAVYNLVVSSLTAYVLKLDAAGNFVWVQQIGGASSNEAFAIDLDAIGNIYVAGDFYGTTDFDPGSGTFNLTATNTKNSFVLKLDAAGSFLWAKQFVAAAANQAYGLSVDASGNVYTTGSYLGSTDFDPDAGTYLLNTSSSTDKDIFVSKLDVNGNFVWAKKIGSGVNPDIGYAITVNPAGDAYLTGSFSGTADFDPGVGSYTLSSAGGLDIFILNLDAVGNFLWARKFGGIGTDIGQGIALDGLGNVYTTGQFQGVIDIDPGPATYTVGAPGSKILLSKLDLSGNYVWGGAMGGSNNLHIGYSIYADVSGNVYTTGTFGASADFDPNQGVYLLNLNGVQDAFIHKMGPCQALTASLVSQTNLVCNGAGNGAATFSASGGSGFTYSWMPVGGTNATATGLSSGNYTCVVTNSCGSVAMPTVTISQPPAITVTAVANNSVICMGNTSVLSATVSGGVGTLTYTWVAGPANTAYTVTPSSTTIYTVNVTDANTCVKSQTVSVATNSLPLITVNSGTICPGNSFTIVPGGAASYTIQGGSSIVSPSSSSAYTVSGTSASGCMSQAPATSTVIVSTLPTVSVNSGTICSGSNFTLLPTGAAIYTIQGGNPVVSPTANTSYTVTGSNAAGCLSVNTATSNVTVNNLPLITVSSSNSLLCVGQPAVLTASGAISYTWNGTQNGNAISFSPTATTVYTVVGAGANGCANSATFTQSVSLCTSISEALNNAEVLTLYPNPSSGIFYLQLNAEAQVQVYTASGQCIFYERASKGIFTIDLSGYAPGFYFMTLKDAGSLKTFKLVKN